MNALLKSLFNKVTLINMLRLLLSWVLLIQTLSVCAQDPVFSRYSANPESENPAFTGGSRNTTVYAIYRNQYPSLNANYITYAFGGSTFYDEFNSGFGISALYDDSADGLYNTLSAKLNYSYRLQLANQAYVNAGLSIGIGQTQVDFQRLIFLDQIDPVSGPIAGGGLPLPTAEFLPADDRTTYLDLGAGALFYGPKFFIGVSANHINNPNNDFLVSEFNSTSNIDGLPVRWSVMAGGSIPLVENRREVLIAVHPQLMYTRQRDFGQLNLGGYVTYKTFDLGLAGRLSGATADALIISAGAVVDAFKIYYAYDFTISALASTTGGAHEIGLSYRIGPEYQAEIQCFDFFR